MNILLFYPSENNAVFYHRLINPFYYMEGVKVKQAIGRIFNEDLDWADVMIMCRVIDNHPDECRAICDKHNIKLIVDYDDYYKLPSKHILHAHYSKWGMAEKQIGYAAVADEVWTTNKRLQNQFLQHNENVKIIPNAIPFDRGQFNKGQEESNRIRFFYAGGKTHYHDIKLLEYTCKELRKNELFQELGQMVLGGYDDSTMEDNHYWDKIEMIWSGRRPERDTYKRLGQLRVNEYMNLYNHGDVGIVPLENNQFNSMKSNLKILECATKYMPAICSRVSTFIDNEPPVKWVEKESDWIKHIVFYLNNPMEIIKDWIALRDWAEKYHSMEVVNQIRYDSLKKLILPSLVKC